MLDSISLIGYPIVGFAVTYLAMETGWHFTTCNGRLKGAQPCLFAQVKEMVVKR